MEETHSSSMMDSSDLPVEPWAFKIIQKYNDPNVRPVSRTSSRISRSELMHINTSDNADNMREDLLRVKSLGRFK